jgi:hypothetical protein
MRTETGWVGLAVVAGILAMAGALAACSQSATAPPTVRSGFGSAGASAVSPGSGTGTGTADAGTTTADAGVTYCFLPTTGADAGAECVVSTEVSGLCAGSASTTGCTAANLSGCCLITPTGSSVPLTGTCYYGLSQTDTAARNTACVASPASAWQTTLP